MGDGSGADSDIKSFQRRSEVIKIAIRGKVVDTSKKTDVRGRIAPRQRVTRCSTQGEKDKELEKQRAKAVTGSLQQQAGSGNLCRLGWLRESLQTLPSHSALSDSGEAGDSRNLQAAGLGKGHEFGSDDLERRQNK